MKEFFCSRRVVGTGLPQRQPVESSARRLGRVSSGWLSAALLTTFLAACAPAAHAALPTLAVNDISVTEGNSGSQVATFTVTLSAPSATPVTVKYTTVDGTAKAPDDYTYLPLSTLTFNAGQTTKAVNVTIKGDLIDEADEGFTLKLSAPTEATIADATGVATIIDNDTSTITVTGATVTEGNSGTTPLDFTIKLSTPNSRTVTVKAKTADAPTTPATLNSDYIGLASTTVSFAPGETTKVLTVNVIGDTADDDPKEYVGFALSGAVNATVGTVGVGTIVDDDPTPTLSVNDVTVTEGDNSQVGALFTVTLSAASHKTVTVTAATAIGTAVSPDDFTAVPPTVLTFAPGQTVKAINVIVKPDLIDEDDEKFAFNLSAPTNATILKKQGVGTIIDNDTTEVNLSTDTPTITEGNSGTKTLNFIATLTHPASHDVSVQVSTFGSGNPADHSDYSLNPDPQMITFKPGVTSKIIPITIYGDTTYEPDESFTVELEQVIGGDLGDSNDVEATILNDDSPPPIKGSGKPATAPSGHSS